MPQEIQRLAKRPRLQSNELGQEELRMMLHNAATMKDVESLQYVGQHLRQRSRRGGSWVDRVADILRREESSAVIPFVLDFLTAHPRYYGQFVRLCCSVFGCSSEVEVRLGRVAMMDLGVKLAAGRTIRKDDIVCAFRLLLKDFHRRMLSTLISCIRDLDVAVQLHVIGKVLREECKYGQHAWKAGPGGKVELVKTVSSSRLGFGFFGCNASPANWSTENAQTATAHTLHADVIGAFAAEAKVALLKRALELDDEIVAAKVLKEPILRAFGKSHSLTVCERILKMELRCARLAVTPEVLKFFGRLGMRKLLPVACAFAPAVKSMFFKRTAPEVGDDSDDGF
mmetsp:Transcript_51233/g.137453  ORF Transcript_51233/g.137453 Transcript_51233/m.137453 type:complete len:341 (+) Transcript_51233:3-1025(+)